MFDFVPALLWNSASLQGSVKAKFANIPEATGRLMAVVVYEFFETVLSFEELV